MALEDYEALRDGGLESFQQEKCTDIRSCVYNASAPYGIVEKGDVRVAAAPDKHLRVVCARSKRA